MTRYSTVNIKHQDEAISVLLLDDDFCGYELIFSIANEQFEEAYVVDASEQRAVYNVVSITAVDVGLTLHYKKILQMLYPNYEC